MEQDMEQFEAAVHSIFDLIRRTAETAEVGRC